MYRDIFLNGVKIISPACGALSILLYASDKIKDKLKFY